MCISDHGSSDGKQEKEHFRGFCLNTTKFGDFWNWNVSGVLFNCPYCGPITEAYDDPDRAHLFPVWPRLERFINGFIFPFPAPLSMEIDAFVDEDVEWQESELIHRLRVLELEVIKMREALEDLVKHA